MLNRDPWPRLSPYELRAIIGNWEPPDKPHCSNCLHAKVGGRADDPVVTCSMGHGSRRPLALVALIRRKSARQFVPAVRCPDFTSMGPAEREEVS